MPDETPFPTGRRDRWALAAGIAVAALYLALLWMRPSGEGWGRGWNLVALWLYGSPGAVVAGAVALWRSSRLAGTGRKLALAAGVLGLAFPLIALLVIRSR